MQIAIINSNSVSINRNIKKGTEIFDYILIKELAKRSISSHIHITAFASGDSTLHTPKESISNLSSFKDTSIGYQNSTIFELALISKAVQMQDKFDLFHFNISNGELILPFLPFIHKPVVITMHGTLFQCYSKKYFSLFKQYKNAFFVSVSFSQRKPIPDLNYIANIYHGIDVHNKWQFNPNGGNYIMWAGRAIPEKGLDTVLDVIKCVKKEAKIFPIIKHEFINWLNDEILKKHESMKRYNNVSIEFDTNRYNLARHYQIGKLFLFPVQLEEPFGFVMAESMACGTPVVAYAKGAVSEIIKDGQTGFIVNSSDKDIRGDWIIKKTGIKGLCEAVKRIYSLPRKEYEEMRLNCRKHVVKNYNINRMVNDYIEVYKKVIKANNT